MKYSAKKTGRKANMNIELEKTMAPIVCDGDEDVAVNRMPRDVNYQLTTRGPAMRKVLLVNGPSGRMRQEKGRIMKKGLVELVFIVDRSGSMAGLEDDTIGGLNATLQKHRAAGGETVVSTVLFDNEMEVLHDRLPIAEVTPLTRNEYWVRGCTALLDAVGRSVRHISRVHGYLPDDFRPEQTIFVITTDGMENASTEYTYQQVKRLISEKSETGWEFLFLGANIDAAAEAQRIGIEADRAATYVADGAGTATMFSAMCDETVLMRDSAAVPCSRPRNAWKKSIERDTASRGKKRGFFGR